MTRVDEVSPSLCSLLKVSLPSITFARYLQLSELLGQTALCAGVQHLGALVEPAEGPST